MRTHPQKLIADAPGEERRCGIASCVIQTPAAGRGEIERGDELLTSTLTLGELLVKPVETGDDGLQHRYVQAMHDGVSVLPYHAQAALRFAAIRGDRSIRAPDAIQLACAAAAGTDLFITNDDRPSRKNVPGIAFIQSLQRAFL